MVGSEIDGLYCKEGDLENQLDAHPKLPMAAINSIARSN